MERGKYEKVEINYEFSGNHRCGCIGRAGSCLWGGESIRVSYADLNLEEEDGALSLYRRLKQASKQACDFRGLNIAGSVDRMAETKQCYRAALSTAVERIDNEIVTNIHNG